MALFNTSTTHTGTALFDFFFGDGGGPNHVFDGGAGNDFILGDSVGIFTDLNNNNAAAVVTNISTLGAAFAAALNIDIAAGWTTETNPSIDDDSIPHTTVYASGGDGTNNSNYYTVTVGAGETLTLDIDGAFPSFDSQVRVFTNGSATAVSFDDDGPNVDPGSLGFGSNANIPRDSFLQVTNNTGAPIEYLIEVQALSSATIDPTDQYLLNVSVTNHAIGSATLVEGNDTLTGGAGNDILFGVGGNDTFIGTDGDGNDYIDGGDGVDRLNYSSVTTDLTIDLGLTTAQNTGGAGTDTLLNIERIDGGSGNDTLTAADTVGDLRGRGGNDTLTGGAGNDFLQGGAGQDIVSGGAGNDNIRISFQSNLVAMESYDGGADTDLISLFGFSPSIFDFRIVNTLENFETLFLAAQGGEDITVQMSQSQWNANAFTTITSENRSAIAILEFFADSTDLFNLGSLTFDANWDQTRDQVILNGADGQGNNLVGTSVADTLNGGNLTDFLNAGNGADIVNAGAGDDFIFFNQASQLVVGEEEINGGEGSDNLFLQGDDQDYDFRGTEFSSIEQVQLSGTNILAQFSSADLGAGLASTLRVQGTTTADEIQIIEFNMAGDNFLDLGGLTFMDWEDTDVVRVTGDTGANSLDGSSQRDEFNGGTGSDRFEISFEIGGYEQDSFDGGVDADLDELIVIGNSAASSTLDLTGMTLNNVDGIQLFAAGNVAEITTTAILTAAQVNTGLSSTLNVIGDRGAIEQFSTLSINMGDEAAIDLSAWTFDSLDGLTITGDADNESIVGSTIGDTINSGDGVDNIDAGAGADIINAGNGDDNIFISDAADIVVGGEVIDGGLGTDSLQLTSTGTYDLRGSAISSIESLQLNAVDLVVQISSNDIGDSGAFSSTTEILGIDGMPTVQTIEIDMTGDNFVDLSGLTFANWGAEDVIQITGSDISSEVFGSSERDIFEGNGGADTFRISLDVGGYETDVFNGGTDSFDGSAGSGDTLSLGFNRLTSLSVGTFDARAMTLTSIEAISFETFGVNATNDNFKETDITLQLNAGQIGNGGIALNALIDGNFDNFTGTIDFNETIEITLDHEGELNLSDWRFRDWNEGLGTDLIVINGNDIEETLTGTSQNDEIDGNGGDDTLRGGAGEDALDGGAGNDRLEGGTFSDTLFGGTGSDILIGGSGNDVLDGWTGFDTAFYTGLSTGVTVDLQVTTQQDTGGGGLDTLIRIENLIGSGQNDTLTGNFNRNRLDGGNGSDTLRGEGGNDTLIGGAGGDSLFGGTGADRLVGGAGTDTLRGDGQRDRLEGGADNDFLFGGDDVDRLLGGDGNDFLTGGQGTDFLFGGTGNDTFIFNSVNDSGVGPFQRDEIRDWEDGDLIDVANIDADTGTSGDQAFNLISGSFTGTAGEIMVQSLVRSGVDVQLLSFDVDGDAQTDMQIWVLASELDAGDFIL